MSSDSGMELILNKHCFSQLRHQKDEYTLQMLNIFIISKLINMDDGVRVISWHIHNVDIKEEQVPTTYSLQKMFLILIVQLIRNEKYALPLESAWQSDILYVNMCDWKP